MEAFCVSQIEPFNVDWMAMMLSMMYVKHVLEPTTITDSHLIVKIFDRPVLVLRGK
jgi:hypothetical protein